MTRFLMTLAVVAVVGATARAGGPPPVYVVVDEVTTEASAGGERITIRGSFTRVKAGPGYEYTPPVRGFVRLSLDKAKEAACRAEWAAWAKAAGTGKVVAVGLCSQAGALLTADVHKPGDRPAGPDPVYTPGHLDTAVKAAGDRGWADEPAARALLAFVEKPAARR